MGVVVYDLQLFWCQWYIIQSGKNNEEGPRLNACSIIHVMKSEISKKLILFIWTQLLPNSSNSLKISRRTIETWTQLSVKQDNDLSTLKLTLQ